MWQVLYVSEHFRAERDATRDLILLTRLPCEVLPEQFDGMFEPLLRELKPFLGQRLLVDMRKSRGRNDPQLEAQVQRWLPRLAQLFLASALVVATAVGQLQAQRVEREVGHSPRNVYLNFDQAVAVLLTCPIGAARA
jgi:hypothetical protein